MYSFIVTASLLNLRTPVRFVSADCAAEIEQPLQIGAIDGDQRVVESRVLENCVQDLGLHPGIPARTDELERASQFDHRRAVVNRYALHPQVGVVKRMDVSRLPISHRLDGEQLLQRSLYIARQRTCPGAVAPDGYGRVATTDQRAGLPIVFRDDQVELDQIGWRVFSRNWVRDVERLPDRDLGCVVQAECCMLGPGTDLRLVAACATRDASQGRPA